MVNEQGAPGMCDDCKGAGGWASNELCETCNGTGRQTAQPLDVSHLPMGDPHPIDLVRAGCDPITGKPAQPLYDSLGRCINFRDVHPAQPGSEDAAWAAARAWTAAHAAVNAAAVAIEAAEAKTRLASENYAAAQPGSGEVVPRSRYNAANKDWLDEKAAHEKTRQAAADEIDRLQSALTAAQQRIAELESELENERARGIHTCHGQCPRPLCVAQRRIAALESGLSEAIEIMTQGERLLPKGEARLRLILEGKEPA